MQNNSNSVGLFVGISFSIAKNSVWYSNDFAELLVKVAFHKTYMEVVKNASLPDSDTLNRRIQEQSISAYHENFDELTDEYSKKMSKKKVILSQITTKDKNSVKKYLYIRFSQIIVSLVVCPSLPFRPRTA